MPGPVLFEVVGERERINPAAPSLPFRDDEGREALSTTCTIIIRSATAIGHGTLGLVLATAVSDTITVTATAGDAHIPPPCRLHHLGVDPREK